jgi:hydrogenase nickel incorporation protein HypB
MTTQLVEVQRDIRAEHLAAAARFRDARTAQGTLVVRLLSSPGSGKTTLLEATAQRLAGRRAVGVLVGDVETRRDADRLAPYAPTVQITTGGACHLEIPLVERAFRELPRQRFDYLFIEDVGNLICPASHDVGEHVRVILLSTTEGDDKPGKYPKAFRTSHAMLITKTDLLPHVPFQADLARQDARQVQPALRVFCLSALHGDGMHAWCDFLENERLQLLATHSEPHRGEAESAARPR